MKILKRFALGAFFSLSLISALSLSAAAQTKTDYTILTGADLTRVVPTSFYFAGQSAQTQMRNSAAASFGKDRYVIAGLVDTSGYSTEISGKYEGFFITDSPVKIGDQQIGTGAYGFGFSPDGKVNIFDLSSKQLTSISTAADANMKRPRPLMMTSDASGVRLYKGKNYVLIAPQ